MQNLHDMLLRGQAAQQNLVQLATYNAALAGNAGVQATLLALNMPQTFWSALSRSMDAGDATKAPRKTR